MTRDVRNAALFRSWLNTPSEPAFGEEMVALNEAKDRVALLTSKRDATPQGSRARAAQQIMLDWWQQEFANIVATMCGGRV